MLIARQSTARTVTIGPVLDADGAAVTTAVVGDFKLSKNGGAPAALNGSATLTHRNTGHYSLALTASDLDTVGQAEVVIDKTTDACAPKELTVIEEAVYDAIYASSATGKLPANVTEWLGVAPLALSSQQVQSVVPSSTVVASVSGAVGSVTGAVGSVVGAVGSVTGNVGGNVTGSVGSLAAQAKADVNAEADTALADAKAAYAVAIEAAILDEGDATALLAAIAAKVEEFLVNEGDATATIAAIATAVWGNGTRTLTAGTNIVLAKGTGVTGFNDLSAAQVNAEVDTALTDYGALKPTTAGRTLDVTATGAAGVDWGNVENQGTTVDLSATTVNTIDNVSGALDANVISMEDTFGLATEAKQDTAATATTAIKTKTDQLTFTTPNKVDATTTTDVDVDEEAIAEAVIAGLGDIDITIVSAWNGETLTIYKGAAYSAANGTSVDYPAPSPVPSLVGGSALFRCIASSGALLAEHTLTVEDAGTVDQNIVWELPASKSDNLNPPTPCIGFILYKAAGASEYSVAYEFAVQTRRL